MKKYLAFLVVLITSLNLFAKAKPYVARVSRVRGEVTVLNSSKLYATVLKRGMRLKEDTSIVTGQKSFAQIIFNDQTKLNIGPNSKALIVKGNTRKDAGVVGLLKGQLRTSVKKK
ncbi:FecR domain-containing protein [Bacteriovoracaceae bacterium]|nr:FecR domain-containing protein [Bacteriovoracaceae bacterium]